MHPDQISRTERSTFVKGASAAETLLVREEAPIVPLWFYKGITFFDDKKIDGIYFNILDEHPLNALRKR